MTSIALNIAAIPFWVAAILFAMTAGHQAALKGSSDARSAIQIAIVAAVSAYVMQVFA